MIRRELPAVPLIDLHLHLEGSLPPETVRALARRHRLPPPPLRSFDGFLGFLKAFGAVCDLLRDEADFERAAGDVIRRCARLGVRHVEILFSPQVFQRRGIPLSTVMGGLLRARRGAQGRPPGVVYIMDGVRQWGGEWFDATVRAAAPYAGRGLAAIGIGGDEKALPCRRFARAFERARGLGLRTTVHAGEAAGPEAIREALRWLRPDRIGHGIAAAGDESLMAALRARGVALEVCPTSNRATGVVASGAPHPLRRLHDAGLPVTVGSDDGAFFGCDIRSELRSLLGSGGFTMRELFEMQRRAARASFLPEPRRRRLERGIERGWGSALQVAATAARRERARA